MHTTFPACGPENHGIFILCGELVLGLADLDVVVGSDRDDRKNAPLWLAALRASACASVEHIAFDSELDRVTLAKAAKSASTKVDLACAEAVVDQGCSDGAIVLLSWFGIIEIC